MFTAEGWSKLLSLGPGEGIVKFLTEKHSPVASGGLGWVVLSEISYLQHRYFTYAAFAVSHLVIWVSWLG